MIFGDGEGGGCYNPPHWRKGNEGTIKMTLCTIVYEGRNPRSEV